MRIAIFGATSQIAKDLVVSLTRHTQHDLVLYARRKEAVDRWLLDIGKSAIHQVRSFDAFGLTDQFDAIINFVGVGNPYEAASMGSAIFDTTLKYDELAMTYLRKHGACRYIFLSSGAVYGSTFDAPVDSDTKAMVGINNLHAEDWYAVAKLHVECRHRASADLSIIDVRVFNYFSHTQDMASKYLITDMIRAVSSHAVLKTSSDYIVRDFLHPSDFYQLTACLLDAPATNAAIDCYSRSPVDKPSLLTAMQEKFGLEYEIIPMDDTMAAPSVKKFYYSLNRRAADFGFNPSLTSLEGIFQESERFLKDLRPISKN